MLKHRGVFAARLGASSPQRARVGGASTQASGGIIFYILSTLQFQDDIVYYIEVAHQIEPRFLIMETLISF